MEVESFKNGIVYDYAFYNDLADPDKGEDYARPVLGGSPHYPYPCRGRTGRLPTKTDPNTESRIPLLMSLNIYVPRDERFGHLKMSVSSAMALNPLPSSFFLSLRIYVTALVTSLIALRMLSKSMKEDSSYLTVLFSKDKSAWRTDEEFTQEMLGGMNPVVISRVKEFPPTSNLDPEVYGDQSSAMAWHHVKDHMDGITTDEEIEANKLFILNHHDSLMPYLRRINSTTTKTYASRTLLFLQNDGRLKPLAIEMSVPHPNGDKLGAVSKVYTPAEDGVDGSIWQLAKAYAAVNDSGVHQLITHFLNTHAVIEPFVIATNRQLSVLHHIHASSSSLS
ncbi:hypothetical protein ACS0TY_034497 [Phlomoides rotata]